MVKTYLSFVCEKCGLLTSEYDWNPLSITVVCPYCYHSMPISMVWGEVKHERSDVQSPPSEVETSRGVTTKETGGGYEA